MINIGKKCLAALLAASMVFGVTGCGRQKKAKKPYVQSTAEVKNGTAPNEMEFTFSVADSGNTAVAGATTAAKFEADQTV